VDGTEEALAMSEHRSGARSAAPDNSDGPGHGAAPEGGAQ